MNKEYLSKSIGIYVRLRPVAVKRDGSAVDEDWVIRAVEKDRVRLDMPSFGYTVALGTDHIYSFVSDPDRDAGGVRYGFLQLHVQLTIVGNKVEVEPLPPPKAPGTDALAHSRKFSPITVEYEGRKRLISWRNRDPLHLIEREEEPLQLLGFDTVVIEALKRESGKTPQFNKPTDIRGEIVYELSSDLRSKWRLRGGMSGGTGEQTLVLV